MKNLYLSIILLLPVTLSAQGIVMDVNLGHIGAVNSLRFSADSRYLLSSSADRKMKIWDVQTGKLLVTSPEIRETFFTGMLHFFQDKGVVVYNAYTFESQRGLNWIWDTGRNSFRDSRSMEAHTVELVLQIGPGGEAVAGEASGLGPNAEKIDQVLAGGTDPLDQGAPFTHGAGLQHRGFCPDGIHSYQRQGEQLTFSNIWEGRADAAVIYPGLVDTFSFSSGGQFLFGSAEGPAGRQITIWRKADGSILKTLTLPEGHYINDIAPDGNHLLLTTADGQTSLYELERELLLPVFKEFPLTYFPPAGAQEPQVFDQAVFSPDGKWIARGGRDGAIYLHYAIGGSLQHELRGYSENTAGIWLGADGQSLEWSLKDRAGAGKWNWLTGILTAPAGSDGPTAPALLEGEIGRSADGQLAMAAQPDRSLQLWDLDSRAKMPDLENADGSIEEGYRVEKAVFSADKKRILMLTSAYIMRDDAVHLLWDLEQRRKMSTFRFNNRKSVYSAAFSPDATRLVFGHSNGEISVYRPETGEEMYTFPAHKNEVSYLGFSPANPNMLCSAAEAEQGTVRLWDLEKRAQIATIYLLADGNWVVIAPNGLFDASPQAMNILFYKVEYEGETEIIELEQLKDRYYEPGLLQKLTGYSGEPVTPVKPLGELELYPRITAAIKDDQLQVQLDKRNGGIGKLSLFVNGKESQEDINPRHSTGVTFDLTSIQRFLTRDPQATNLISLRAYNEEGWLKSASYDLAYRPEVWSRGSGSSGTDSADKPDSKMYVITLGTSAYAGTDLDLNYPDQDAAYMARAMRSLGANLFAGGDSLEVYALTTNENDKQNLATRGIDWRPASKANFNAILDHIKRKAKAEDVLFIYLSGHGTTYGDGRQAQFYYLTKDIENEGMMNDAARRKAAAISSGELTDAIKQIAALKQILVVDACHSGSLVNDLTGKARDLNPSQVRALDRMKDRTGMFILSGSAADQRSFESRNYGNGLLTYALLKGMNGGKTRKDENNRELVDVMDLFQYVREEVPKLATAIDQIQTPTLGFPSAASSFDIGIYDQNADIPIGQKKAIMLRPILLNQAALTDDMGLMDLLEQKFREENSKADNADFTYLDFTSRAGAYAVRGLYTVSGKQIDAKIKLFREGQEPVELKLAPQERPDVLVRNILREVKKVIISND